MNIDYSKVDNNEEYEDVKTSSQDDEDRFFNFENFPVQKSSSYTGIQDF